MKGHEFQLANLLTLASGPVGSAIAGILLIFLVSWTFPPAFLGTVAILELIALFSVMALTFGLDQAYVREYASAVDRYRLFGTAIKMPMLVATFVAIIAVFTYTLFEIIYSNIFDETFLFISVCYAWCSLLMRFLSIVIRMSKSAKIFSIIQVVHRATTLAIISTFLIFTEIRTLNLLLCSYLFGIVNSILIHAVICRQEILYALRNKTENTDLKNMLRFGIPTAFAAFCYALLSASDRLSLSLSANHYELGIYTVAVSVAGSLSILTAVFGILWAPYIYRLADGEGATPEMIRPYLEVVTMLTFFVGAAISGLAWLLPFAFPVDYDLIPGLIPACMSLPLLYILSEAYGIGIAVSRKTKFAIAASGLGALCALMMGAALVPIDPLSGAASAILMGSLAFLILRTEFSGRLWQRLPVQKLYLATFLYVLGCALSLWRTENDACFMVAYWIGFACVIAVMFRDRMVTSIQSTLVNIRQAMG